jgi:very-short-patch-repair endonuclease
MRQAASPSSALRAPSPTRGEGEGADSSAEVAQEDAWGDGGGTTQAASPSSALRAPSPTRGEGERAEASATDQLGDVWGPSPLMGEGGRRPDEGGAKIARARALRRRSTEAEQRLWAVLRDRRLVGFKFRRQVSIGRYIADFACYEAKLIVELDGSQHAESAYDRLRDAELAARGFGVLRIWNSDLFLHRTSVLETIHAALVSRAGQHDARG